MPLIKDGRIHGPVICVFFLVCLKLVGLVFAVFVFGKFSPLVDANLYLTDSFSSDMAFRTRLIQHIVTFINGFGGAISAHLFFGLVSLSGVLYYIFKGGTRLLFCLTLMLPSSLIWTSIVGKEAIFYGCFTLSLVIWTRFLVKKCTVIDYILISLATVMCALLRPHYAVVLCWLFLSAVIVDKLKSRAWLWLIVLAIVSCILVYAFEWRDLLVRGYGAIERTARASRFELLGISKDVNVGFDDYVSLLPLGAIFGIVGPMPSELIGRPIFIPFFLEGVLILLSPVALYFYACTQSFDGKQEFKTIFFMCLAPAIIALIVLHSPFGLLNPGSAIRWRVNFETVFYLAPLLLLYCFKDNHHNENHPLSP